MARNWQRRTLLHAAPASARQLELVGLREGRRADLLRQLPSRRWKQSVSRPKRLTGSAPFDIKLVLAPTVAEM